MADSVRRHYAALRARYSPSAFLFAAVLAVSLVLLLESFVLAHYFGIDVLSSLTYIPVDIRCLTADTVNQAIGVHCFGDYYQVVGFTSHANPWVEGTSNYPAAGMLPQLLFGSIGRLFDAPRVGLIAYLVFLAAALVVPAVWAAKGKSIATRIILFGAFGIVSLPALMTLDRGNSVGFAVPALLAYLVGLRRDRPWLTVVAIVIACLIKPQFVILVVALLAARRWRHLFAAIGGIIVTNLLAFAFWPRDFPSTLLSASKNILGFGGNASLDSLYPPNVSLGKGMHDVLVAAELLLRKHPLDLLWYDDHATIISGAIVVITVALIFLGGGSRGTGLPPTLAGIILMMCGSLFSGYSASYYLIFALAAAAVLLRDPADPAPDAIRWRGVFDGERRGTLGGLALLLVTIAVLSSVSRLIVPIGFTILLQGNDVISNLYLTTASITPVLWILATVAALAAWSFRASVDSDVSIRPREE